MSNKADPIRAAELSALLAKYYPAARPHMVARAIVAAVKLARYAKVRGELECNYPMTQTNINRAAARLERAALKINAALREAIGDDPVRLAMQGAPTCTFGGDPRGACGMLHIPGLAGDGWGRDGFPLY